MAKYYHSDVARWEGEGGAPAEIAASWNPTQSVHRTVALWQIVCSIAILTGSVLYARRKGWI